MSGRVKGEALNLWLHGATSKRICGEHTQIWSALYTGENELQCHGEKGKREVQRGTLAPRSALGEHITLLVKYNVLYFTHGEDEFEGRTVKRNEQVCGSHDEDAILCVGGYGEPQ